MSFKDFISEDNTSVALSLDEEQRGTDTEKWAITISPPLRRYDTECKLQIYLDLIEYLQYIRSGQLVLYPEFADNGRLHYHGIFTPSKDKYGEEYLFWASRQGKNTRRVEIRVKVGYTKTGKTKWKKLKTSVVPQMVMVKFLRVDPEWDTYMMKNSDNTNKILGYRVLSFFKFREIANDVRQRFNVTMPCDVDIKKYEILLL